MRENSRSDPAEPARIDKTYVDKETKLAVKKPCWRKILLMMVFDDGDVLRINYCLLLVKSELSWTFEYEHWKIEHQNRNKKAPAKVSFGFVFGVQSSINAQL